MTGTPGTLLIRAKTTRFLGSTDFWESIHTNSYSTLFTALLGRARESWTGGSERGLAAELETVTLAPVSCSQSLLSCASAAITHCRGNSSSIPHHHTHTPNLYADHTVLHINQQARETA